MDSRFFDRIQQNLNNLHANTEWFPLLVKAAYCQFYAVDYAIIPFTNGIYVRPGPLGSSFQEVAFKANTKTNPDTIRPAFFRISMLGSDDEARHIEVVGEIVVALVKVASGLIQPSA